MNSVAKFALLSGCLIFAAAMEVDDPPHFAQIVALDECDPATFNAAFGPDFCRNVTLGAFTTVNDIIAKAAAGTPDPGWDFEPDKVSIKEGTNLSVVDQGGEPHTFTEVGPFGGGFRPKLNAPGEDTVSECAGGFQTSRSPGLESFKPALFRSTSC